MVKLRGRRKIGDAKLQRKTAVEEGLTRLFDEEKRRRGDAMRRERKKN